MIRLILVFFLFGSAQLHAQSDKDLIEAIGPHGLLTYAVIDLSDGSLIQEKNVDLLVPPASTLKALTTLSALNILGEDFKYITELHANGRIEKSVLQGDIVLVGGGDPTLGSKYFDQMSVDQFADLLSEALITKDIRNIEGDLIISDAYYTGYIQNPDWLYRDLGNYYGCGLWSLNIQDNMGTVTFRRSNIAHSETSIVTTSPNLITKSHYSNEVKIGPPGSGDRAYIYGTYIDEQWTIKGTLPPSNRTYTIKSALSNVPDLIAQTMLNSFQNYNINLSGRIVISNDYKRKKESIDIWSQSSPELLDICRVTNEESVNLFAEALIQTIGSLHPDPNLYYPNSLESGINYSKSYWKDLGIDLSYYNWYDGSGLSPINGVTARSFAQILHHTWSKGPDIQYQIKDILAEAGHEGTLKNVVKSDSPLYRNLWAKSGTISHTKAYTGVFKSRNGRHYGFYINASRFPNSNSSKVRNAMMAFLADIAEKN